MRYKVAGNFKTTASMKKIITIFIFTIFSITVFAQDKITTELKTLSDNNEYEKIIEQHASKSNDYSAKSLYYIGKAYYMKEDDENCKVYGFVN